MDIYRADQELFEDVEDITEEDIEDVTRDIDLCNYEYVPEESDIEAYVATPAARTGRRCHNQWVTPDPCLPGSGNFINRREPS